MVKWKGALPLFLVLALILVAISTSHAAFTDIGAGIPGVIQGSLSWGDYDGDGDLDLFVLGYAPVYMPMSSRAVQALPDPEIHCTSIIYRNDGGRFVDIEAELIRLWDGDAVWGDIDGDCDLDLVLSGSFGSGSEFGTHAVTEIYRNDSGTFHTADSGILPIGGKAAWGDYDNDGDLDLAVSGRIEDPSLSGIGSTAFVIYRNDGKCRFTDTGRKLRAISGQPNWVDYDNDGDLDLAISGLYKDSVNSIPETKVYRNDGSGQFTEVSTGIAAGTSAVWADFDGNGYIDIVVSKSTPHPSYTDISLVTYSNNAGAFTSAYTMANRSLSGKACCIDYDNDGDPDIADGARSVFVNDGTGRFTSASLGIPDSPYYTAFAWGDYDSDGRPDIGTTYAETVSGYPHGMSAIYHDNDGTANTPPTMPTDPSASVGGGSTVTFRWGAATDAETPSTGLTYNIRIGSTPGGSEVCSGMASASTGLRRLPSSGNMQTKLSWTLKNSAAGTLYWSVQAVDSAYAGSPWTSEQKITRPANVSLTPDSGVVQLNRKLSFVSAYTHGDGNGAIARCYLLINKGLTCAGGVPLLYQADTNKLYVQNDDGGLLGGLAPGSDNVIENNQCKLYCKDTVVSRTGNDITVNWAVELKTGIAGLMHKAYTRVEDRNGVVDGWEQMGTISVATSAPVNLSLTPNTGSMVWGSKQLLESTYADADGQKDISKCYLLINKGLSPVNAASFLYRADLNRLYVQNDAGTGWVGGYVPGSNNIIQNSQCALYCQNTTVTRSGSTITVQWTASIKPSAVSLNCLAYTRAEDRSGLCSVWERFGGFYIIGTKPSITHSSPWPYLTIPTGVKLELSLSATDVDGSLDIAKCIMLINSGLVSANGIYLMYTPDTDKLWLLNDTGSGWLGGFTPGSENTIQNSQCKVYCKDTRSLLYTKTVYLTWSVEIKPSMSGTACGIFMRAEDKENLVDGWTRVHSMEIE